MAETITITDNRTGKTYTIPLYKGAVRAMELRNIKVGPDDFGVMTYDPAFMNTANCRSAITYIDANWTGLDRMKQWADKLGNQPAA